MERRWVLGCYGRSCCRGACARLVGYLIVELEGLFNGDVEGGHDDGVSNAGGGDDRSHDAHEGRVVHDAEGEDRGVDHAGDEGDNKGADEREQALGLGAGEHGDE